MESKYEKVYNEILNKIEKNEYAAHDKLPTESELMSEYKVSRDTVRKSLSILEQKGYIKKSRGKSAIVLDIHKLNFPVSGITSFEELNNMLDLNCKTYVENLEIVKGDTILMERLQVGKNDEVYKLLRVREIDGEKIIIDKDYFNRNIINNLPLIAAKKSVYKYIEGELGLKIGFGKKEITVEMATDEDRELLDLKEFNMVVVVKSYTYLEDTTLFQYTVSRHRPDRFKFIDFTRRSL